MATIVVGAGVAGLSAAHTLAKAGERVVVLEARNRIGGRIYTNRKLCPIPIEFGAEFIHGERAATWALARRLGVQLYPWRKTDDSYVRLENDMWMTLSAARAAFPEFDLVRNLSTIDTPIAPEDESLASYLRRAGFSEEQLHYVHRMYANAAGDAPQYLSALATIGLSQQRLEMNGQQDFRILDGYDTLVKTLATDLDIRLDTPVSHIEWGDDRVSVLTLNEETFAADAAIITLPLGVLQSGRVQFAPQLPSDKQNAIRSLKMGPALKLIYYFESPIVDDPEVMAIYSAENPPMWWSPSVGQGLPGQVWTAFATGDWARDLLALGEDGALLQGLKSLRMELDKPYIDPIAMLWVNWTDDPYALGGYSVVPVGAMGMREVLSQPTPPLYWAGEATATDIQAATVHGAYLSGLRAAEQRLSLA